MMNAYSPKLFSNTHYTLLPFVLVSFEFSVAFKISFIDNNLVNY